MRFLLVAAVFALFGISLAMTVEKPQKQKESQEYKPPLSAMIKGMADSLKKNLSATYQQKAAEYSKIKAAEKKAALAKGMALNVHASEQVMTKRRKSKMSKPMTDDMIKLTQKLRRKKMTKKQLKRASIPQLPKDKMVAPAVDEYVPIEGDIPGSADSKADFHKCHGFIEELKMKDDGAAYTSNIFVGYRAFECLPDTGSFDLQILSQDCENLAGEAYNRTKSEHYEEFPIKEKVLEDLMFGSGPVRVRKGSDMVALVQHDHDQKSMAGPHHSCRAEQCPLGEIVHTTIKEFMVKDKNRNFEAICGIGLGPESKMHHRLVSRMGVDRMGFCLRQDMKEGGIIHWNYNNHHEAQRGFKFSTVNVVRPYWGMAVSKTSVNYAGETPSIIACEEEPCLAVIDTGTTLHSMDSQSIRKLREHINKLDALTCDESIFKKLPELCYTDENSNNLCLRPEDYVMKMPEGMSFEQLPNYIRKNLAFTPNDLQSDAEDSQCMLAIGDSGEKNMHIFGMQWFRSYWFGFDTATGAVEWSRHDGNCNPPKKSFAETEAQKPKLQVFDPHMIRPSALALRVEQAKKHGPAAYRQVIANLGMEELKLRQT